jgi:hypothetical protein
MTLSELFSDESKWVKDMSCGVRAPDGSVRRCAPEASDANCWCLIGGASHLVPDYEDLSPAMRKIRAACKELFPDRSLIWNAKKDYAYVSVSHFNDHPDTTFADVQSVIQHVESNP